MKKTTSIILIAIFIIGLVGYYFFSGGNKQNSDTTTEVRKTSSEQGGVNSKFKIIAVGDSLTAGFDLPLDDSYPKILEAKLLESGKDVEVINAGVSGETTAGLLERADFIAKQNPDMLLITTGGNDAFRNLPIKNTRENIQKTLQIFKKNIEPESIYLLQIESTANLGLRYRKEFNEMYKEVASLEEVKLLPFVVKEVFLDSSKMLTDGIHPNRLGYEYIVDNFIFPEVNGKIKLNSR
ncbi:arylesterase [Candidatus Falkowbacteria bacterium]|nr:arylesterase [Candidatus Falkowbacteria bacterium]